MKIAFLLYPTENVKVREDTSFWIMHELKRRGHKVFHFLSESLFWRDGGPQAFLHTTRTDSSKGFLAAPIAKRPTRLSEMDCVFIRKEPPFDRAYLAALQLLNEIKDSVFVLNDPAGIAMSGEKLFTLEFSRFIPETCVTEDTQVAAHFIQGLKSPAVIKPLHLKGGHGVFVVSARDRNLPSLLEMSTGDGREKIMIQRFIDTDRYGDKRILVLDGKILGTFLRKPSKNDFRANLSCGALLHKTSLTFWDRKMTEALVPELQKRGLFFVGIDVIGNHLTEINVTSPAGIADLKILYRSNPETKVADFIESRVSR